MIGLIEGTIRSNSENPVIIMAGGVGYAVFVPPGLLGTLKTGETVTLHTHLHVTDDDLTLYGFTDRRDLTLFRMLRTVSGIGPKTALLVVDRGTAATERAIMQSDTSFFTSVPRLGKKNAQKIIIELKPKLTDLETDIASLAADGETSFIISALKQMGFTNQEINSAIRKLPASAQSPEAKIREALKLLSHA